MIQILAGTFGYYNGRKMTPITCADGPQTLDPELESRLVREGVAKYVDPQTRFDFGFEDRKMDELKKIAKGYGIDASTMRKKSEVIEAIEAAQAEPASDSEEPPQIEVEELV